MRGFGILFGVFGTFIAGGGAGGYVSGSEALGIACMVIGACLLGIGVMMFLTDFGLRLARSSPSLHIRGRLLNLELEVNARLRNVEGEEFEEGTGYIREAAGSTEG